MLTHSSVPVGQCASTARTGACLKASVNNTLHGWLMWCMSTNHQVGAGWATCFLIVLSTKLHGSEINPDMQGPRLSNKTDGLNQNDSLSFSRILQHRNTVNNWPIVLIFSAFKRNSISLDSGNPGKLRAENIHKPTCFILFQIISRIFAPNRLFPWPYGNCLPP